jgi:archaellum component FlaC
MGRIQADVDPFNRFVRVQVEQLERIDNELKAVVTEMDAIALDLSTVEEGEKEEGER